MTETTAGARPDAGKKAPGSPDRDLSVGLFIVFVVMGATALVSAAYAASMIGFLADDGYFIAYSYLCDTVPTVAFLDQILPFVLAAAWAGCIYLGVTRDYRFAAAARVKAIASLTYAAISVVLGPFTFRVGPSDVDTAALTCGRWPRDITSRELELMQIDWLGLPISAFPVTLIVGGLFVYVFLRLSKRVRTVYRRPEPAPAR